MILLSYLRVWAILLALTGPSIDPVVASLQSIEEAVHVCEYRPFPILTEVSSPDPTPAPRDYMHCLLKRFEAA